MIHEDRVILGKNVIFDDENVSSIRICRVCGFEAYTIENLEKFPKSKNAKYGRLTICKRCMNKYQRERNYNREWNRKNPRFPTELLFRPLRKCNHCGLEAWNQEDLEEFSKKVSCRYGRGNECKKCHREKGRNYRLEKREAYNETSREYYQKHREKILKAGRIKRIEKPISFLITEMRTRSKKKNLPFNLNIEYVEQLWEKCGGVCSMTGVKMKNKGTGDPHSFSLDRIIPEKGYVKGNVRFISWWYNLSRQNWGDEFVLEMCKHVVETAQKKREVE